MSLIKPRVCLLFILLIILIIILRQTSYEKFTNIKNNKVLWVIAHSDNYTERANNVKKIQEKYNFIQILPAYYDIEKCYRFLASHNLKINTSYWNKSKNIHQGKIGHLCTMLDFFFQLKDKNYDYGVWIEDDLIVEKSNIDFINKLIKTDFPKPMKRLLGIGTELVVVKKDLVDQLIQPFLKNNIYNPPDVIWNNLGLVEDTPNKVKRMDEKLSSQKSTILTSKILKISDVNKNIEKYQKENFSNLPHQAFYMWGMKPDESKPCPMQNIKKNNKYIPGKIVGPKEIEPLLSQYPNPDLAKIWPQIPKWIVKADLGRLIYLYFHGGFYFDIDCKINTNFLNDINKDTILFTEFILESTDKLGPREIKDEAHKLRVANYAMGSTVKNNKFYQKCIEECMKRLKIIQKEGNNVSNQDVLWVCGPDVITTVYHQQNLENKKDIQLFPENIVQNENFGSWR